MHPPWLPSLPLTIVVLHWICDWLLQSDWMATHKSKDVGVLIIHAFVATIYCAPLAAIALTPSTGRDADVALFWLINLGAHVATDAITSRMTARLWFFAPEVGMFGGLWSYVPGRRHWFFVVIGFDQVLHYLVLAYTWHGLVQP